MLSPGSRIGHYEVAAQIGAGGMGVVYRATDTNLRRDVALKLLPESLADDADRLARLQREAEVLASLNHFNIAQIYGIEKGADTTALVMELVEGPTLAERLEAKAFEPDEAIGIATQIAAALEAAHARGIVHRDLKPANIKLRPNGTVAVLDFGLAKPLESADSLSSPDLAALTSPALTEAGIVLGTAAYMSPEQARGTPVDKRTDIWAFGAVLYEMLTGQPAFPGDGVTDTIAAVLRSQPDWEALPELPPLIAAFLKQCLEKNSADRIHDIADVRLALVGAYELAEPDLLAAAELPAKGAGIHPGWVAVAGLVLALGTGAAVYRMDGVDSAAAPYSVRQLTFRNGRIGEARFTPDGQVVVYGASWDGEAFQIYSTRLDSFQSRPLELPPADLMAVSNESRLALAMSRPAVDGFLPNSPYAEVDLAGGAPRTLDDNIVAAEFGADGELAAKVRLVGNTMQVEFPPGTVVSENNSAVSDLHVTSDGNRLCFQSSWTRLMVAERGEPASVLLDDLSRLNSCAWSPDGDEVWFTYAPTSATHTSLEAIGLDGRNRRQLASLTSYSSISDVSRDGSVLINSGSLQFSVRGAQSSAERERELGVFDASRLRYLTPAGDRMLITDNSAGAQQGGTLFLSPTDGTPAIQVGSNGRPLAITRDGQWIAVLGTGDSSPPVANVITLIPTGAGTERVIELPIEVRQAFSASRGVNEWDVRYPEFSDDGTRLLLPFGRDGSGTVRAYVHNLVDGSTNPITPAGVSGPVIMSPDGELVVSDEAEGLFIYAIDTGERRELPGGADPGRLLRWSAAENLIYVVEPDGGSMRIFERNIETGQRRFLREVRAADPAGVMRVDVHIARDGEAYAYSIDRNLGNLFLLENIQ